jgi:predicted acylesterase/phospholipase RssA
MKATIPSGASWNLSFSGAGHLISYHLGVAQTLRASNAASIQSVAGSSSGAIVAAVLTCMPYRLEEYSDRFMHDGGRAFANFKKMLNDPSDKVGESQIINRPTLHIATTKCSDGSLKLFSFQPDNIHHKHEKVLLALKASCKIPVSSFHPWDVFSKHAPSYPDYDGIEIDGDSYVDGGIAAPCPVVNDTQQSTNIIISPISGSSSAKWNIRPLDTSWKLPLIGDLSARCGTFAVRPSVDNLRAIVISAGAAPPQVMKDWHNRGVDDANEFLKKWNECPGP